MPKELLLFGFGPFLSYSYDPSQFIAEELNGSEINGFKVRAFVLPVEHATVSSIAEKHIEKN